MHWLYSTYIAHRGLHDTKLPENSIGAFEAAVQHGYAIECDVHCTADKQLVINHDADMLRATGQQLIITDQPYHTLQTLRLFETEFGIARLEDLLDLVGGKVPLLIEVKTGTKAEVIGPLLLTALASYKGKHAIMSFDPRIVLWLKKHAPEIPRGLLSGTMDYPEAPLNLVVSLFLRSMVSIPVCKPHFIAYDINGMPSKAVRFWRGIYKLPLLLWVVRSPEQLKVSRSIAQGHIFENFHP